MTVVAWDDCITLLYLGLGQVVLKRASLVDVEGQVPLQLLDLVVRNLHLLIVLIGLLLEGAIRLHEVVVKFDELLHFGESVPRDLSLVLHFVAVVVNLSRVLVTGGEGLILARKQHDPLLRLHLLFHVRLVLTIQLLPEHVEVDSD